LTFVGAGLLALAVAVRFHVADRQMQHGAHLLASERWEWIHPNRHRWIRSSVSNGSSVASRPATGGVV
jgi:hypothetical protein